ncbi:uncharacterized protein LOC118893988 [Balaenoptera musculus]|uniref:Uncharacterized protein LOC118893988 n=1 Tax=Balaenoptera musculus TaxID=9771 RepID=A0A8B8XCA6_BALMU|nr:uncharacterized protein LOC118893988 [Balaenoptera musculus]
MGRVEGNEVEREGELSSKTAIPPSSLSAPGLRGPTLDDRLKEASLGVTADAPQSHLEEGGGRRLPGPLSPPRSLRSPHHVPGAGIKPGFAPASSGGVSGGLQEGAARLLPVVLAQPSLPCSGEDPGPERSLAGASGRQVGSSLLRAACSRRYYASPTATAGSFRSAPLLRPSSAHKAPPPAFSPELKLSPALRFLRDGLDSADAQPGAPSGPQTKLRRALGCPLACSSPVGRPVFE